MTPTGSFPNKSALGFVNGSAFIWLVLVLPALLVALTTDGGLLSHGGFRWLGDIAAFLTIITLALTPLLMLFPQTLVMRWLMKHRRQIGMAAFAYGVVHTLLYVLVRGGVERMVADLAHPLFALGWLTLLAFVPPAVTSFDWWLRKLGPSWKDWQRITYVAAILLLAHWLVASHHPSRVALYVLPLVLLELWRVHTLSKRHRERAAKG